MKVPASKRRRIRNARIQGTLMIVGAISFSTFAFACLLHVI